MYDWWNLVYKFICIHYTFRLFLPSSSEEQQVQRLMARNQYSKEAAEIRIQAQMPLSEKCGLCTRIIDNSKDMKTTYLQTVQLHKELSKSLLYWKVRMLIALCAGSVIGLTIYVVKCIFSWYMLMYLMYVYINKSGRCILFLFDFIALEMLESLFYGFNGIWFKIWL